MKASSIWGRVLILAVIKISKEVGSFLAPDRQVLQEIALLLPEKGTHLALHLLSLFFR